MSDSGANPAAGAPSGPSKLPLLLALVNLLAVAGAGAFLYYTKMVFKRPPITEEGERERLTALHAKPAPPSVPGLVNFDTATVNILASPDQPRSSDGSQQIRGKPHYVTLGYSLEIRDVEKKNEIETIRPMIQDQVLSILGRKSLQELTTVQGRYMLRTQIIDMANRLASKEKQAHDGEASRGAEPAIGRDSLVTNVYFTDFTVQ